MNTVQNFCKQFRVNELGLTLEQMGNLTETNPKTISAFEHGRSNNINHVYLYVKTIHEPELLHSFLTGINHALLQGA